MQTKLSKSLITVVTASLVLLAGCGNQAAMNTSQPNNANTTATNSSGQVTNHNTVQSLADLTYQSGKPAYITVNHNQATLNPSDYKYVHVNYANLDHLNRTSSPNTAYLDSQNVANDSLRVTQYVKPTGWHQKFINNNAIINRGHEIAYSLSKGISVNGTYSPSAQSGDQNNPKNLFTQTAFSNQEVQTIFETKVRNALREGKKVIYQVTPMFKGANLMASGVHMQALSTDKTLDFNVYLYNVQPGVKFDYATGRSTIDNSMKVPLPAGAPHFNNNTANRENTGNHAGMVYRHHHWIRDYLIYRGIKHFVKNHAENRGYAKGYEEARRGYEYHEPHHSLFHFGHHRRW